MEQRIAQIKVKLEKLEIQLNKHLIRQLENPPIYSADSPQASMLSLVAYPLCYFLAFLSIISLPLPFLGGNGINKKIFETTATIFTYLAVTLALISIPLNILEDSSLWVAVWAIFYAIPLGAVLTLLMRSQIVAACESISEKFSDLPFLRNQHS